MLNRKQLSLYLKKQNRHITLNAMFNRYFDIAMLLLSGYIAVIISLALLSRFADKYIELLLTTVRPSVASAYNFILFVIIIERLLFSNSIKYKIFNKLKTLSLLGFVLFSDTVITPLISNYSQYRNLFPSFYNVSDLMDVMVNTIFTRALIWVFLAVGILIIKVTYFRKPKNFKESSTRLLLIYAFVVMMYHLASLLPVVSALSGSDPDSSMTTLLLTVPLYILMAMLVILMQNLTTKLVRKFLSNKSLPTFHTVKQTIYYINNDMIFGAPQSDTLWFDIYRRNTSIDEFKDPNIFNSGNATVVPYILPRKLSGFESLDEDKVLLYGVKTDGNQILYKNRYLTLKNYLDIYEYLLETGMDVFIFDGSYDDENMRYEKTDFSDLLIDKKDHKRNLFHLLPFVYKKSATYTLPDMRQEDLHNMNIVSSNFVEIWCLLYQLHDAYLNSTISRIIENTKNDGDEITYFYELLKIGEYILTLIAFNDGNNKEVDKLESISIGKLEKLVNDRKIAENESISEEDIRNVKNVLYELRRKCKNNNKCRGLSISGFIQTIANLRNYFLGHGAMIYSVDSKIVRDLSQVIRFICKFYVSEYKANNYSSKVILNGESKVTIDLFFISDRKCYLFNKYDKEAVRYVDFYSGEVKNIKNNKEVSHHIKMGGYHYDR